MPTIAQFSSRALAAELGADHVGDAQMVSHLCESSNICNESVTFVTKKDALHVANQQKAVVITDSRFKDTLNPHNFPSVTFLYTSNPRLVFAKASQLFTQVKQKTTDSGISASAVIGKNCIIDETASIAPYVVIGDDVTIAAHVSIGANCALGSGVTIGEGTQLHPRVCLYDLVSIGAHCLIHAGATIGSDGFGFEADSTGQWYKIHHFGRVVIEDYVEIGANTAIDRGTIGDTHIKTGSKIDNLVHIAHNVCVGASVVIAGQSGFAGGVQIGEGSMIGAQVGVAEVNLPARTFVLGGASLTSHNKPVQPNTPYTNLMIAKPAKEWYRMLLLLNKLSDLFAQVKKLTKKT